MLPLAVRILLSKRWYNACNSFMSRFDNQDQKGELPSNMMGDKILHINGKVLQKSFSSNKNNLPSVRLVQLEMHGHPRHAAAPAQPRSPKKPVSPKKTNLKNMGGLVAFTSQKGHRLPVSRQTLLSAKAALQSTSLWPKNKGVASAPVHYWKNPVFKGYRFFSTHQSNDVAPRHPSTPKTILKRSLIAHPGRKRPHGHDPP
jgi:hypothetical protein